MDVGNFQQRGVIYQEIVWQKVFPQLDWPLDKWGSPTRRLIVTLRVSGLPSMYLYIYIYYPQPDLAPLFVYTLNPQARSCLLTLLNLFLLYDVPRNDSSRTRHQSSKIPPFPGAQTHSSKSSNNLYELNFYHFVDEDRSST